MKFVLFFTFLFVMGCSSNQTKTNESDPAASISISNQDFKKSSVVAYSPSRDRYVMSGTNALGSETMSQLDANSMAQVTSDKDPMSVMMSYCYRGEFDKAFELADSIFNSYSKHPSFWNQLGSCHLLKGNERKALLFYNKSLEVKSNYTPALNNIGVIYKKNGQDQKAHVAFDKASKSSRFAKTPRFNLAYLYLHNGIGEKALSLFNGLLSDYPNEVEILVGAANSNALTSRWSEALEIFSRIPDQYRSRSDVGLNMALAAYQMNRKDLAKQVLSGTKVSSADQDYYSKLKGLIGE